jgi:hypothetical protein
MRPGYNARGKQIQTGIHGLNPKGCTHKALGVVWSITSNSCITAADNCSWGPHSEALRVSLSDSE